MVDIITSIDIDTEVMDIIDMSADHIEITIDTNIDHIKEIIETTDTLSGNVGIIEQRDITAVELTVYQ